MAMRRMVDAAVSGETFPVYGSGRQIRDFTYVTDVVAANLAAGATDVAPGTVVNIAGGSNVNMLEVIDLVGDLAGAPLKLDRQSAQPGDVERTGGSTETAYRLLAWEPRVTLREGLASQVEWTRRRYHKLFPDASLTPVRWERELSV
jgi:nucleoside-diphosphate-sugar epimerase